MYHTYKLGLVFKVNPMDYDTFFMCGLWDADHAGSDDTTKSTGGFLLLIKGPYTKLLLDYGSRLQTATSKSTPEAELVSGADALIRSFIPMQTMAEEVYSRDVEIELWGDNTTAVDDMKQ